MGSVYDLKPAFQNLLRPLCAKLKRAGVTPNHVTVVTTLLSFVMGGAIMFFPESAWPLFALPAFLFVRMALNAIDGMMAREYDMASKLGAILNEVGDVLSDAALYLPLAVVPSVPPIPVVSLVVLAVISEMAGVVAMQVGGTRRYDGPMGKSDRAFVIGLLSLLMGLGIVPARWLSPILWGINVLLVATIVNRCRRSLREVDP